jgi:hypothetical protein
MDKPNPSQMVLELKPLHRGAYTQLLLHGPVCTNPQGRWLGQLLRIFSTWNGYPVRLVLPVDRRTASWSELWVDALRAVPDRHFTVTFQMNAGRGERHGRDPA